MGSHRCLFEQGFTGGFRTGYTAKEARHL
jgi:hypothetical protein